MLRNTSQKQKRAASPKVTKKAHTKSLKKKTSSKRSMTTSTHKVMSMDDIFVDTHQRTYRTWKADPITGAVVKKAYDQIKFGPTAFNSSPLRFTILETADAKQKFLPYVLPGNKPAVETSPVTAILSYDSQFNDHLDFLSPGFAGAAEYFKANPQAIIPSAQLNAHLQVGYLITALRAQGLDVSPAVGMDADAVNTNLFEPNAKTKSWKAFMYLNIGHANREDIFPRSPRFDFDTVSNQV